jgi:hypothetical protein
MAGIYTGAPTPPGEFFPYVDITPDTASILEPLFEDGLALAKCHNSIEETYPLYKLGHAALGSLAYEVLPENREKISFLHGITLYEVTASIVRPWAPKYSMIATNQQTEYVKQLVEDPELVIYELAEAFESFITHQENTAKLIAHSIEQIEFFDQTFTLQGAAMARVLETKVIESAVKD